MIEYAVLGGFVLDCLFGDPAHLHDLAHGLVAQDHVVAVTDGALPDGMYVL